MLKHCHFQNRQAGFSMLELLTVILIIMILAALAIPLVLRAIEGYQMEGAARSVSAFISRARYEAQRRNQRVCVAFIPSPAVPGEVDYLLNTGPGADPCAGAPTYEPGELRYTLPRNLVLGGPEGSATCPISGMPPPWSFGAAGKTVVGVTPPNFQVNFSPRGFMELPGALGGTWTIAREVEYFCLISPPTAADANTARFAFMVYLEPTGKARLFQRRGTRWMEMR
ncbi:MAG TPA: prepilin-type N-terminal cleavage/methylation domain-containing protein [Candidatus Xenobia bacterium]|nr:prepilin-type N-terminal cleavage/methylation domain-containing protein [Candidatus Xenobia bacterium]